MSQQKQGKVTVNIIYPCYICAEEFTMANAVIHHVRKAHGYILVARHPGHRRPADGFYMYANRRDEIWQVQHWGCPSCWYHTPKINGVEQLMKHIMEVHEPERIEGFINPDKEQNELMDSEEEEEAPVKEAEVESELKINIGEEEEAQLMVMQAIKQRLDDINGLFKTVLHEDKSHDK
ncbi:hypothetical protein INT47_012345 [Mucor saturninus]|uniref:C2H2-type domain-containing protein n=1 Tax=Mucor saturninus TaxID=64648 RepID=A0A8H7V406_9FUNG|nr:hypothetical protein INT47_012345 [Mucor saturninus]